MERQKRKRIPFQFNSITSFIVLLIFALITAKSAPAKNLTLSNAQKKAFLNYYSPVILKRTDEDKNKYPGIDWITNYFFDGDRDLSNNKVHWEQDLKDYIYTKKHPRWQIRPTLYSAIIEFTEKGQKNIIMLYQIYHANNSKKRIHDWERIEVRVDDTGPKPGMKEKINYVVITQHSTHLALKKNNEYLQFHKTPSGNHPIIFQAEWSRSKEKSPVRKGELHFVKYSAEKIITLKEALIPTRKAGDLSFHYVFVNRADRHACRFWNARAISQKTARELVSNVSYKAVHIKDVKRIQYELQDLADVFATNVKYKNKKNSSWQEPDIKILMEKKDLFKGGVYKKYTNDLYFQWFLSRVINPHRADDDKYGYPVKHWFWGAYLFDHKGNFYKKAFKKGAPSETRKKANGFKDCHNNYWWQHDYFAHDGTRGNGSPAGEKGKWLPLGWHTREKGGFDGRWARLFKD